MGRRGPQKTPTKILKQRGSPEAKRRKNEPEPGPGRPKCPQWMNSEGKKRWKELMPQLEAMGLLTEADKGLYVRYCQTYGRWVEMEQWLSAEGAEYVRTNKMKMTTGVTLMPHVFEVRKISEDLTKMEREMGLSPASRASLAIPGAGRDEGEMRGTGRDPGMLYFPKRKAQ